MAAVSTSNFDGIAVLIIRSISARLWTPGSGSQQPAAQEEKLGALLFLRLTDAAPYHRLERRQPS